MKTIIQKPILHINSEELPHMIRVDLLGVDYDNHYNDYKEIYDGNSARLNDPIKIDTLRKYLDQLEAEGANYVSIDFHTDHQELELDGIYIGLATPEEIIFHEQKDKDFQINFIKEKIEQHSDQLRLFKNKLQKLSGEESNSNVV